MNDKCSETNRIMQTFISVFSILQAIYHTYLTLSVILYNFGKQSLQNRI